VEFRKGIGIITAVEVISILSFDTKLVQSQSANYLAIYLVSSVTLLRMLRNGRFKAGKDKIQAVEMMNLIGLAVLSAILSLENVERSILKVILSIYNIAVDIFIFIFSWIFLGIGYIMMKAGKILEPFMQGALERYNEITGNMKSSPGFNIDNLSEKISRKSIVEIMLDNPYINPFIRLLIIAGVVYFIIKFFEKKSIVKDKNKDYRETREFIHNKAGDREAAWNFKKAFRRGTCEEQIRKIYRKFLCLCSSRGIEIKSCDTTQDINIKSQKYYDSGILKGLREIYIKVRYGEHSVDKNTVNQMVSLLKKIEK
jgi:hypothetical protein